MLKSILSSFVLGLPLWVTCTASASDFPNRPIKLLVGSPPGASTDTYARIIGEALGKSLGQSVMIENRTGASGIIATNTMLNSPADGYTLQFIYTSYSLVPHLYKDLKYDSLRDVSGISLVVTSPLALVVNSTSPIKGIPDLVAMSKKRPLNFGSAGIGSGGHLTGEMLRLATNMSAQHVPYRGAAPAAAALAAGDIDFAFVAQITAKELTSAGKLRPIAVTSTKRSPAMPDIPTMQELGIKDYEFLNWFGVVAPSKTPREIVEKINRALVDLLKQTDVHQRLTSDGSVLVGGTPAEFDAFLADDILKSGKLANAIGLKKN
jgi:tripartite-type tricarboxylate transporter receptor subunit TctC